MPCPSLRWVLPLTRLGSGMVHGVVFGGDWNIL